MNKDERFPSEVTGTLTKCGWCPGRHVGDEIIEAWRKERLLQDGLDMFPAARAVLEEFGGLTITPTGPGVDFARLALEFGPSGGDSGQYLQSRVDAAGVEGFYPLGGYGDNDGSFYIEPGGAVYVDFQLDAPVGKNIDEALVNLLLGVRWS